MWRAFFMAVGATLCILGLECMVLEKAVLAAPTSENVSDYGYDAYGLDVVADRPTGRTIEPPEWAPWSFLSAGAVVLLYALSVRAKSD